MDFTLSDDQRMILEMLDEVCEKEFAPRADEISETGEFPSENVKKLAELDLFGITIPKEFGGLGMDYATWTLIAERISKACATTGLILGPIFFVVILWKNMEPKSKRKNSSLLLPVASL